MTVYGRRPRTRRPLAALATVFLLLALFAGPAAAQQSGLVVDDDTVVPGQVVTVTGTCPSSGAVALALADPAPRPLGETVSGPAGFDAEVTIPLDVPTGVRGALSAECADGTVLTAAVGIIQGGLQPLGGPPAITELQPVVDTTVQPMATPVGGVPAGGGGMRHALADSPASGAAWSWLLAALLLATAAVAGGWRWARGASG